MIVAVLDITENGTYTGFTVKGHSGSAPKGKDIVCAAVSAIVQTALIGIDEVADIHDAYSISDGFIKCVLPENADAEGFSKAQTIIRVMHLGLQSIAQQYHDFVRIKED